MSNLEETELQRGATHNALTAQLVKIKAVESRLAQIDSDLQKFDEELIEAAISNNKNVDWERYSAHRHGLELEKSILPDVVLRLKGSLPALQSASHLAYNEFSRILTGNAENELVEKIKKMLDEGETNQIIQAECGLEDHDFYRVLALAKRPTTADT